MNSGKQHKYIFITGGVVSGLGKGIMGASLGLMIKSAGLTVEAQKMDPYLNIDPGTMSPYEHGEVYVLADGSETDLDLGHYERFLNTNLSSRSTLSAGKIYKTLLDAERTGEYLGHTVQLIPHVTNLIKNSYAQSESDVKIIEIGGSTGDMEAEIFLESLRQFKRDHGNNVLHVHLGYVPYLSVSGEYKTKPLQTSLRELLRIGIAPDIIAARYEPHGNEILTDAVLEKIALFGNLPASHVIPCPDLKNIYAVPLHFTENTALPSILTQFCEMSIDKKLPDFFYDYQKEKQKVISVALVTKYTKLSDAYLSVIESIKIAATKHNVGTRIELVSSTDEQLLEKLKSFDAIIVPGGFGNRGMEGKINAINFARTNNIPFLGICLGLQLATIEYARNCCAIPRAVTSEMDDVTSDDDIIIDLIPEQLQIMQKGGTMRLGNYVCTLKDNTLAHSLFTTDTTIERHRHRLEVQNKYCETLEKHGLVISGKFLQPDGEHYLVEMIELPQSVHPYFIATQSHPEFLSRPDSPHPLFDGLIQACL